ncbi:hypothetical protein [Ornithinicoccus hortensis]|uniref:Uncharacterized protein n=1 Tax=Ornithinicoccus hortensis TaxID=82346 RepID=A0A542YM19_9MICO|nr:hypothetical protein [Ornithinicoccus hortensis]TQL49139.1 hypothetical protein FB467_0204 [Ornithinicoccus hortensis]
MSRRWVPWRRRLKGAWELMPNLPGGDDPISMTLTVIILILCLPIFVLVIVWGLEFLVLLLLLPFVVLARSVFGHQWVIEARKGWTPVWEEPAGNWAESAQAIRDVAAAIEQGNTPPANLAER